MIDLQDHTSPETRVKVHDSGTRITAARHELALGAPSQRRRSALHALRRLERRAEVSA